MTVIPKGRKIYYPIFSAKIFHLYDLAYCTFLRDEEGASRNRYSNLCLYFSDRLYINSMSMKLIVV